MNVLTETVLTTEFLFNAGLYAVWCVFFNANLNRRFKPLTTYICNLLYFAVYCLAVNGMLFLSEFRMLMGPIILLVMVLALYDDFIMKRIIVFVFAYASMAITEVVVPYSMLSAEQIAAGIFNLPLLTQFVLITMYYALICFLLFGATLFFRKFVSGGGAYISLIRPQMWIIMIVLLASQYVLITSFFRLLSNDPTSSGNLTIAIFAFLGICADAGLLIVLRRQIKLVTLEKELHLQQELGKANEMYYAQLVEQYKNARQLRHDLDNHLFTMQLMLKENEIEKAKEYLKGLENSLGRRQSDTNPTAEVFLENRSVQLKSIDIEAELVNNIPKTVIISDIDLVSALGNLLDNAAEACAECTENRFIKLNAEYINGYIVIKTQNPFVEREGKKIRRIAQLERGYGTSILRDLAKKYDGEYKTEKDGTLFNAALVLKCNGAMLKAQS